MEYLQEIVRIRHNGTIIPKVVTRNWQGTYILNSKKQAFHFRRIEGEWVLSEGILPERFFYQIIEQLEEIYQRRK